jgi:osmotically-inducible protein OsmY
MKSNLELQKDIHDELKKNLSLINTEIDISVDEGVVTLTGIVDSLLKKQAAVDATEKVAEVKTVINKIEVKTGKLTLAETDMTKSTFGNFENILSNTEN